MRLFDAPAPQMSRTLRGCAHLLSYPDVALRQALPEIQQGLHDEAALSSTRLAKIDKLISKLVSQPAMDSEANYVELFDRGRGTALHLFEHVHGDSRDRGPAMIDLAKTYEAAGLLLVPGELPDFLPVVLQYASTQPAAQARAFLAEIAHILQAIHRAVHSRNSAYSVVLASVLELAGEEPTTAEIAGNTAADNVINDENEPSLDETWAEPKAFDGCPTQEQVIKIVRRRPAPPISRTGDQS